ncbi:hypothetical protein ACLESD_19695 [Pyxidicoccus sp. 3LFB2]
MHLYINGRKVSPVHDATLSPGKMHFETLHMPGGHVERHPVRKDPDQVAFTLPRDVLLRPDDLTAEHALADETQVMHIAILQVNFVKRGSRVLANVD